MIGKCRSCSGEFGLKKPTTGELVRRHCKSPQCPWCIDCYKKAHPKNDNRPIQP